MASRPASRPLEDRVRSAAGTDAVTRDRAVDPQGDAASVEPDEVERVAHPEGVDGGAPRDEERVAGRERAQKREAEETSAEAARLERDEAVADVVDG